MQAAELQPSEYQVVTCHHLQPVQDYQICRSGSTTAKSKKHRLSSMIADMLMPASGPYHLVALLSLCFSSCAVVLHRRKLEQLCYGIESASLWPEPVRGQTGGRGESLWKGEDATGHQPCAADAQSGVSHDNDHISNT